MTSWPTLGITERPREEKEFFLEISGVPAARSAAAFDIVGRDGTLNTECACLLEMLKNYRMWLIGPFNAVKLTAFKRGQSALKRPPEYTISHRGFTNASLSEP